MVCLFNIRLLLDVRSLQCKISSANSLNKIDPVRLSGWLLPWFFLILYHSICIVLYLGPEYLRIRFCGMLLIHRTKTNRY